MLSPNRTITIAGKDYVLDGSFATLRAIQQAFDKDIVFVLTGILDMRLDDLATLIAVGAGVPRDADAIGQAIVDTMDIMRMRVDADYYLLKTELIAWLTVAVAPSAEREKKSADMNEMLANQKAHSPSPGGSTASSASEPSAGSPPSSGEPT
jgi:hypothetical protein